MDIHTIGIIVAIAVPSIVMIGGTLSVLIFDDLHKKIEKKYPKMTKIMRY